MGEIMRGKNLLLLCGLVAITFAPPAWAADPNIDGWEFKAAPYIWTVSLDGDMIVPDSLGAGTGERIERRDMATIERGAP